MSFNIKHQRQNSWQKYSEVCLSTSNINVKTPGKNIGGLCFWCKSVDKLHKFSWYYLLAFAHCPVPTDHSRNPLKEQVPSALVLVLLARFPALSIFSLCVKEEDLSTKTASILPVCVLGPKVLSLAEALLAAASCCLPTFAPLTSASPGLVLAVPSAAASGTLFLPAWPHH